MKDRSSHCCFPKEANTRFDRVEGLMITITTMWKIDWVSGLCVTESEASSMAWQQLIYIMCFESDMH